MNILKKIKGNPSAFQQATIKKEKTSLTKMPISYEKVMENKGNTYMLIGFEIRENKSIRCEMRKDGERINVWVQKRPSKLLIGRYYVLIALEKIETVLGLSINVMEEESYFAD